MLFGDWVLYAFSVPTYYRLYIYRLQYASYEYISADRHWEVCASGAINLFTPKDSAQVVQGHSLSRPSAASVGKASRDSRICYSNARGNFPLLAPNPSFGR